MVSYIKLTPISGAGNEDPPCYLVEFDEAKILLDCGWDDSFDTKQLENLSKIANQVDAVLLSHSDLRHLGAYPYAHAHLGLCCPSYSTLPVHDFGMICLYDAYQMKTSVEKFEVFMHEHIDAAFQEINQLRYSQPIQLSGKCKGISITAYAAGHSIGGTVWKIKKDTETIIYAPEYNHKKERHLNKTTLLSTEALARPSIFITHSMNAELFQLSRKVIDQALFSSIDAALNNGGSVLIPVDSATRVLELSYMLEHHWSGQKSTHHLILLNNHSKRIVTVARTMLEWMGDDIAQIFPQRRQHPFDFKHFNLLNNIDDVDKLQGQKVILAPFSSMNGGFSFHYFVKWANKSQNLIIIPDRSTKGSFARRIYEAYISKAQCPTASSPPKPVRLNLNFDVVIKERIPLVGEELSEYLRSNSHKMEKPSLMLSVGVKGVEGDSVDSDDENDASEVANILSTGFDVYMKVSSESGRMFDQLPTHRMFPAVEVSRKVDDYGEYVDERIFSRQDAQDDDNNKEGGLNDIRDSPGLSKITIEDKTPSKYKETYDVVQVNCLVLYLDLEGRSDGHSIKNIISQVAPRKLVLVGGTRRETDHLAEHFRKSEVLSCQVFTPLVGECMNVSLVGNIYQLRLTDALISSLQISTIDSYELAYVDGMTRSVSDGPSDTKRLKLHSSGKTNTLPLLLDLLPENMRKINKPKIMGELKLSGFCRKLQESGIPAEFTPGGALIVNHKYLVKKTNSGNLSFSGPLEPDYYALRDFIYSQYAFLY